MAAVEGLVLSREAAAEAERGGEWLDPWLLALTEGASLEEAAAAVGVHPRNVWGWLSKRPHLLEAIRTYREALRETGLLMAHHEVVERIQGGQVSTRDLVDYIGKAKAEEGRPVGSIKIEIDW